MFSNVTVAAEYNTVNAEALLVVECLAITCQIQMALKHLCLHV